MFEAWADGSVRGNPGLGGIGVYIEHDGWQVVQISMVVGNNKTNNEVEYEALIATIEWLVQENSLGKEECFINIDSSLVHGQVVKNWKCNYDHLRVLRDKARELISAAPFPITIKWDRRTSNEAANELAQSATLDYLIANGLRRG